MRGVATIHIGQAKTGSTALQQALTQSRSIMFESGLLYPTSGTTGPGHHRLAEAFTAPRQAGLTDIVANLRSEISASGCDDVLISSEAFAVLRIRRVDVNAIADWFPSQEVHIGVLLREHGDYAQSLYSQYIKTGRSVDTPDQFVDSYVAAGLGDFATWLERYQRALNPGCLHAVDYHLRRNDSVDWLLAECGINYPDLVPRVSSLATTANQRLGAQAATILREIAIATETRLVGRKYFAFREFLGAEIPDDPPANFLSPHQVARIRLAYAKDLATIRTRWCPDFGGHTPDFVPVVTKFTVSEDVVLSLIDSLSTASGLAPQVRPLSRPTIQTLIQALHDLWCRYWDTRHELV